MRRIGIVVTILAILGIANAGYLLWQHFAPIGSGFCNISATLSCDVVNKSTFAEIFGFPVSGIGIGGNLFFLVVGILLTRRNVDSRLPFLLLIAAAGGMAFSLYLTYVEAFWLGVYCPLCLLSQAQITLLLCLGIAAAHLEWRSTHPPPAPDQPAA